MDGGKGVAGVNRAFKGVGTDDLGDVADLCHIQLGGHAWRHILADGRCCKQDMAVMACHGQHLGRKVLCQGIGQSRAVGMQHLGHACHLGNGTRHFRSVVSGHQYMHLACTLGRRCHGVACNRLQRVVVMFGNDQYCHVVSPE